MGGVFQECIRGNREKGGVWKKGEEKNGWGSRIEQGRD